MIQGDPENTQCKTMFRDQNLIERIYVITEKTKFPQGLLKYLNQTFFLQMTKKYKLKRKMKCLTTSYALNMKKIRIGCAIVHQIKRF